MRDTLTEKLIDLYDDTATDDWPWFEEIASYNNAKLPHALILSGRWSGNERATQIGIRSLRWLAEMQRSSRGRFRPIGCNGFSRRGQPVAKYDQQPLEAHAMLSAAIEAFNTVQDPYWCELAHLAFDWFLGRNDLGRPLYDTTTGGCHDGLQENRVNENQGAESTLAFLLSLAEMQLLENTVAAFQAPETSWSKDHRPEVEKPSVLHAN
jgi:hypothetical protein